jgi:mannose/cellobiose epimerase-like protein (N-acyl-D-glucosamine 2-epimerase family)
MNSRGIIIHYSNLLVRIGKTWRSLFYTCYRPSQLNQRLASLSTKWGFRRSREVLEQILSHNILPFWYPQVIDLSDGGYKLNHDLKGAWMGPANKRLVMQARTVWFFSRLANTDYSKNEHLKVARHGYEFLKNQMWDKEFGGFYWEVDSPGNVATIRDKHLYGQAFGLYALSEYAIASGDKSAIALAQKLFNLLEFYANDLQYGGYLESFDRDWRPKKSDVKNPLGVDATIKTMNTHLHLLEAITIYYLLTKDRTVWERLIEMIFIQSNAVVRKTIGACTDKHERNWAPLKKNGNRISYGHDLENIWLLIEACNTAGISNGPPAGPLSNAF